MPVRAMNFFPSKEVMNCSFERSVDFGKALGIRDLSDGPRQIGRLALVNARGDVDVRCEGGQVCHNSAKIASSSLVRPMMLSNGGVVRPEGA